MNIKSIKLVNFRNYSNLELEFDKDYNIVFGDNAQGKTNIIEAIFLCAAGRSHRTSKDFELLKSGSDRFYVGLEIEKEHESSLIEISYLREERKKIKINEIPQKKTGDLMGHLYAVIFSPEDLNMVKEGPSERRRFLDMTISQLRPSYFYDLQQYAKILFQRNSLLKEISINKSLEGTLAVWDTHLVRTGSKIMKARLDFMKKLDIAACVRHSRLTGYSESLKIKYTPSFDLEDAAETADIAFLFEKAIEKAKSRELFKCTTLYGPQRDDYDIILNDMSTKVYGSQGQQRTSVLSIKLAEIDIMKEETGEYPVLLLDDVLSELDGKRQEFLFETVENLQTFITCTDRSFFTRTNTNARFFQIRAGEAAIE